MRLLTLLKIVSQHLFCVLDRIIPKNRHLVVFGQAEGRYSDNNRALFEFLNSNETGLESVWIHNGKDQANLVRKHNPTAFCFSRFSPRGHWSLLRARTIVVSHGFGDISSFFMASNKTNVLLAWHGIGIKKFGIAENGLSPTEKARLEHSFSRKLTAVTSSSETDRESVAKCFRISTDKVFVTGLPRSDQFFKAKSHHQNRLTNLFPETAGKKLGLYAPTFRADGGTAEFFPFSDLDIPLLENFLKCNDLVLLLRPHQNDIRGLEQVGILTRELQGLAIDLSSKCIPDVNQVLPYVDLVITDYSSIHLDLLLTDTPCIFIPYDLGDYEKTRGLIYDYDSVTPGPKVLSQQDLIAALDSALEGAPTYRGLREEARNRFHEYQQGGACRRTCELISSLA